MAVTKSSGNAISLCLVFVLFWIIFGRFLKSIVNRKRLSYPPGPKPLPLVGNLRELSTPQSYIAITSWAKTYGDVIHLSALGNHLVYLNSFAAATELFEKRSAIYSSRPRLVMVTELMGVDWSLVLLPYGSQWRKQRKMFHQFFNSSAVGAYQPSQLSEVKKFLINLLKSPDKFMRHIRRNVSATILRVTYGLDEQSSKDDFVSQAEECVRAVGNALNPGAYLVDTIPQLRFLPDWFPGASFKLYAEYWKNRTNGLRDSMYQNAKDAVIAGSATPCAIMTMMRSVKEKDKTEEEEMLIKGTALTAFSAGTDTTVSTIQSFFLAMAMNPDIQAKAQAQLDAVVEEYRLPNFNDRQSLPYIEAIMMETLRWRPAVPLGIPHYLDEDDEYNGYFIPKNSIVFANIWALLHDESVYPDPYTFRPGRFLDEDGKINPAVLHPEVACFGFGRRACPGKHIAYNTLFITIASVLFALEIKPACDEYGNVIPIRDEVTDNFLLSPKPFECSIQPRSEEKRDLILQSAE